MESPRAVLSSATSSNPSLNDENPRIKLLCSFSGSIMPRPQDGKLRYVGGETRIICLSRDIKYAELMTRMRELHEGAHLLKYQQPDEDLDSLVSVVNDDDVMNMMEEYGKLGSKDGFTRLRVFLFSHPEQESSPRFVDSGFKRDSERRYVDALNSLNDASDIRQLQKTESCGMNLLDDSHLAEQFYNQRNFEMLIPQLNLRELTIPRIGSGGQHQQSLTQRYNDVEAPTPWSPAYYSPGHHGVHDTRPFNESPSSARHYVHPPLGEFADNISEECGRQQVNQQFQYDQSPHFSENVMSGFPGNLYHGPNVLERNSICGHCRMSFQKSPPAYPNSRFNSGEQPHVEQSTIGNNGSYAECLPNRETRLLNRDPNSHNVIFPKEQTDPRSFCNEHSHERGLFFHHHLNHTGMNCCHGHGNIPDAHHVTSNYVHDDPRFVRSAAHEFGREVFRDQFVPSGPHIPIPVNERGVRYGNSPYAHGIDNTYQVSHGHVPVHPLKKNVQNPIHAAPYEPSNPVQQSNCFVNQGFIKVFADSSPMFCYPKENVNTLIDSPPKGMPIDGSGYCYDRPSNLNYVVSNQGIIQQSDQDRGLSKPVLENSATPIETITCLNPSTLTSDRSVTSSIPDADACMAVKREYKIFAEEEMLKEKIESLGGVRILNIHSPFNDKIDNLSGEASPNSMNINRMRHPEACLGIDKVGGSDTPILPGDSYISLLPELLDSKKRAALEGVEEVKGCRVEEHTNAEPSLVSKKTALEEPEVSNAIEESELDSETDNQKISAIEPTKAEEEAIARGLQTIKNDDLEEIRELGTGTYGAVYHGKWKGSDVAIKKIKASCFAGRPSERERLIADFWKEALFLSSLHHPNVVSFYGIVRDGPDGSLVTVTEFMVNGSLKQFIKKKDRTIDRRKRLIIAMDAAFGMEYLHGKNIVHFDLKCENLLVNMRDPHRPVCKIGDLGLSKVKQHTLVSGGVRGTLPWMAPELLSGKSKLVTDKIDVYSFGIVMWELLTGEEPYADMHSASIIGGIVNNQVRPQIPTWCDPEWRALMEACWGSDPSTRPSFTQISQKLRSMSAAAISAK